MSAEIIQFVPRANPNREAPLCNAPDALGPFWERRFNKPAGSYRGQLDGVIMFEVDDIYATYSAPDGDCA